MELQNYFKPPGGISYPLTGGAIACSNSISPDRLVHHITGTGVIKTINLPYPGFTGPIYLISDDGFTLDTSGNIAIAGSRLAGSVTVLLYDESTAKWYPINRGDVTPPDPPTAFDQWIGVTGPPVYCLNRIAIVTGSEADLLGYYINATPISGPDQVGERFIAKSPGFTIYDFVFNEAIVDYQYDYAIEAVDTSGNRSTALVLHGSLSGSLP